MWFTDSQLRSAVPLKEKSSRASPELSEESSSRWLRTLMKSGLVFCSCRVFKETMNWSLYLNLLKSLKHVTNICFHLSKNSGWLIDWLNDWLIDPLSSRKATDPDLTDVFLCGSRGCRPGETASTTSSGCPDRTEGLRNKNKTGSDVTTSAHAQISLIHSLNSSTHTDRSCLPGPAAPERNQSVLSKT